MFRPTKIASALALLVFLSAVNYASAEETSGTVRSVDSGRNQIVLKGVVKDSTYDLGKDAYVCIDGYKRKLSEIKEGDSVRIHYDKKGDHMVASEVRALRNAKETNGTIKDIFSQKNEITLKGTLKNTTYVLEKNGTVSVDGKVGTLADLRENDKVFITYQVKGDHNMASDVRATRK